MLGCAFMRLPDRPEQISPVKQSLKVELRATAILVGLCLVGSLSILPQIVEARSQAGAALGSPMQLIASAIAQTIIVFAPAAFLGLRAAAAASLPGAPLVTRLAGGSAMAPAGSHFGLAAVLGIVAGIAMVALDLTLFQHGVALKPDPLGTSSFWTGLLSGILYGGVNEELLYRLFIVSALVFLGMRVAGAGERLRPVIVWSAIVVAALAFGAAHLGFTSLLAGLTPVLILRALLLNAVIGLVCGWIYVRHGLECAITAHALSHVPLQLATSWLS